MVGERGWRFQMALLILFVLCKPSMAWISADNLASPPQEIDQSSPVGNLGQFYQEGTTNGFGPFDDPGFNRWIGGKYDVGTWGVILKLFEGKHKFILPRPTGVPDNPREGEAERRYERTPDTCPTPDCGPRIKAFNERHLSNIDIAFNVEFKFGLNTLTQEVSLNAGEYQDIYFNLLTLDSNGVDLFEGYSLIYKDFLIGGSVIGDFELTIDNPEFQPVPEPSQLGYLALLGLGVGIRRFQLTKRHLKK